MDKEGNPKESNKVHDYRTPAEREREYKKWEQKEKERCFWRKLIGNNGGWGGKKGSPS